MRTQGVFASGRAAVLSAVAFVGLILSLLIQINLISKFGLSQELDAYFMAWAAPSIFIGLMAMFFDAALVPKLQKIYLEHDLSFCGYRPWILEVIKYSAGIAILGFVISCVWSIWMQGKGVGFKGIFIMSSAVNWTFFFLYAVVSLLSTLLRSKNRLYWVSIFALLPHLSIWLTLQLSWVDSVVIVGIAMVVGVSFQLLMVATVLAKSTLSSKPIFRLPSIRRLLVEKNNTLISLLPFVLLPLIDALWISSVEIGGYSALSFVQRIISAVYMLIAQAIFTALLPIISKWAAQGRDSDLRAALMESLELALFTSLPISLLLIYCSDQILNILLFKSSLDSTQVSIFVNIMNYAAPSVIGIVIYSVLIRAIHAQDRAVQLVSPTLLLIACYFVLSKLLVSNLGGAGLACAQSIFWVLALTYGLWLVCDCEQIVRLFKCAMRAALFSIISLIITALLFKLVPNLGYFRMVSFLFLSGTFFLLSLSFNTPIKEAVNSLWRRSLPR